MNYLIQIEKAEFDKHIKELEQSAETRGFWRAVDELYRLLKTGNTSNFMYGDSLTQLEKHKWEELTNALED